ncbi:ABC transporter permease [Rothia nasimurium]
MNMPIRPILSALRYHKAGALLIAAQIALTLAVICNAAYVIHNRLDRMGRDTGIAESDLMVVNNKWVAPPTEFVTRQVADIAMLRALPGVADAVATNTMPLAGSGWRSGVRLTPTGANVGTRGIPIVFGDEHLLPTLGLKLIAGRNFQASDVTTMVENGTPDAAAIILTRAFADHAFPAGDALGKQMYIGNLGAHPSTIIGIVERMHAPSLDQGDDKTWQESIIVPMRMTQRGMLLIVRAQPGQLPSLVKRVPEALKTFSTQRVIPQPNGVLTFQQVRDRAYKADRGLAWMLGGISVILLLVTAAGIVGLTSFWVGQRRRQIGIRRALGATRRDILVYFLTENSLIATAGLIVGVVLAFALNRWMMSEFEISRLGLFYVVTAILGLLCLGQLAVLGPAMRASRVPPVEATRTV